MPDIEQTTDEDNNLLNEKRANTRTIKNIHQEFANNSGYRQEVIWDLLSAEQDDILKDKIKELIADQKSGQKSIELLRETLFNNIWAQRKYTNKNSLTAIIYVLVTKETDFNRALESREFSCHPVFRARKCDAGSDSSKCCMIFVDETGRVYQNWESFVKENVLPKSTMVAPRRGVYTFDENRIVELDIYETPANSLTTKVLKTADTTSAVAGFFAACVPIAAILTLPVTAPVMAVAAGVGLTAAGYSAIRSGSNLVERSQHEQSIGLGDRQARNSWLGVVGGVIGLGASGATKVMTTAAAAGQEISVVTELVVNGMNISSIVLSGTGVANGVLDMVLKYNDDEEISMLDVVQLSASLVLFTHSVSNFQMASRIVNETRNSTIQSYRDGLSNRQRRMFDKMSKETIRIRGGTRGKIDIIRSVNDIPSKQYLNDLYKINKNLNAQKVRPAFGEGGGDVVLNNELPIADTGVLRNSVQHSIGPDVLGQVTQPIPQSNQEAAGSAVPQARLLFVNTSSTANEQLPDWQEHIYSAGVQTLILSSIKFANGAVVAMSEFDERLFENIVNADSFEDVITTMANLFSEESFRILMHLAETFIKTTLDDIHSILGTFISTESLLYRLLVHCMERYTDYLTTGFLLSKTLEIIEALRKYFLSLNPNSFPELMKKCPTCAGHFAICDL